MKRGAIGCSRRMIVVDRAGLEQQETMTLMLARRDHSSLIERLWPVDHAGARPGDLQDLRLQSGARNVARQSRQVGRQAQTVQIIP
jgi:hypothetical protein